MELKLTHWQGLPVELSITEIAGAYPGLSQDMAVGMVGEDTRRAYFKVLTSKCFPFPLQIWYIDEQVVKIEGDQPEIINPDALLEALGEPEARLDCHYDVDFIEKGEWVYPRRGLSLCRDDDGSIVRLTGFHPMSLERYQSQIRFDEPISEFPEPDEWDELDEPDEPDDEYENG